MDASSNLAWGAIVCYTIKSMVTVYSKPQCVQCNFTYRELDKKKIEYRTVDMSEDADALARVKELGYLSAPVVVVNEDTHWSGFRPDLIQTL